MLTLFELARSVAVPKFVFLMLSKPVQMVSELVCLIASLTSVWRVIPSTPSGFVVSPYLYAVTTLLIAVEDGM